MFQMAGKPTKQWSSVLLSVSEKWKSEESRMRLASNTPNGALQDSRLQQRQRRHEHIRHVVDDEIEPLAGETGQPDCHVGHARKGAVDAIDDEGEPQPGKDLLPGAGQHRAGGEERANDAERREEVHEGCGPGDAHPSTADSRCYGRDKHKGAPKRSPSMPAHPSLAIRNGA